MPKSITSLNERLRQIDGVPYLKENTSCIFANTQRLNWISGRFPYARYEQWDSKQMRSIQETRRLNLELLIEKHGSTVALAEKIGRSQTQISNIKHGRRGLGEKLARYIERTLSLPNYFLDEDRSENKEPLEKLLDKIREQFERNRLDNEELFLLMSYRKLTDKQKCVVKHLVKSFGS